MVNRTKEKQISIRLSEEEFEIMKSNIENSGISQRDYIADCILNDSKNMTLERELETANAKIKELEIALCEIRASSSSDYEKLKNEYAELEEKALEIQKQAKEYKVKFEEKVFEIQEQTEEYNTKIEEKEQSYKNLLYKAKNVKDKLKKEIEDKNEDIEYSKQLLKTLIINTFISLLYAVVISVIAAVRHFEPFAFAYIPVLILFIWNIAVIYGIIKYFSGK